MNIIVATALLAIAVAFTILIVWYRDAQKQIQYFRNEWITQCEVRTKLTVELIEVKEALRLVRKGLDSVSDLIDSSHGVSGLHLNGDEAPWEDLREGGRYEEWLEAFDTALKSVPRQQEIVLTPDQVTCKVEPSPEQVAYRDQTGINQ